MVNVEQIRIIKHISAKEIAKKIKDYSIQTKILKRLIFINLRYSGQTVLESCKNLSISPATGYKWQERWNFEGYAGLIPKYGGGRPSKLSNKEKEALWEALHARDHWTTNEVK